MIILMSLRTQICEAEKTELLITMRDLINSIIFLQDYGVVDYIRLRVMPVLGTSPSIFGQAMASYVLCTLAGQVGFTHYV